MKGVTVVIPTLGRERVLVETLEQVLGAPDRPEAVIVVDQTPVHETETDRRLTAWRDAGAVWWERPAEASIPKAMNLGLRLASTPLVLFLDDDVRCHPGLFEGHRRTHAEFPGAAAVVGRVVQPWQTAADLPRPPRTPGLREDFGFPFHGGPPGEVANVMAGNLSVKRERALAVGGFDEQFTGSAFRFETDFARRLIAAGETVRYAPGAGLDHLRVRTGGTRKMGSHLTSTDPKHGVGDYYFALRHASPKAAAAYAASRMTREVRTRFHLARPWWIPVKLLGEVRAWRLARRQFQAGPLLMGPGDGGGLVNGSGVKADPAVGQGRP